MPGKTRGLVKLWNPTRGFGFVKRDDGERDVFLHVKTVRSCNYGTIANGQLVEVDYEERDRGPYAVSVIRVLAD